MQDQPNQAPRRVKTKAPGIYRSVSGKYEIQYRDSDGRLRFKTVGGSFEGAKEARADVLGRIRKGEAVRSTRQNFGEFAEAWLTELNRRPRTIESYGYALNRHLLPRFKRRKLTEIRVEDVARLVIEMEKAGYSGWTISGTVTVLSAIMRKAARTGLVSSNPVSKLERVERPKLVGKEKRILSEAEIAKLLEHGESLHALISVLLFAGLRISEALGLTWDDLDFSEGFIRVRKQLDRRRQRVAPKTSESERDVVLVPQLGKILREHRIATRFKAPGDFVFPAPDGRGRDHSATRKGIGRAVERAGLADQSISAHAFRHTFASLLIVGLKLDPARVAAQLGHANPAITLAVYTHLFEQARHADELRAALGEGFGHLLDGNGMSTSRRNGPQPEPRSPVQVSQLGG
jgi:integrase